MSTFGPYPARCVAIHDGDTITLDIDLGFDHIISGQDFQGKTRLSCRLFGINAPELSNPNGSGIAARNYLETLIHPGDLCTVLSHGWDKYGGRFDGTVILTNADDLSQLMLDAGYAAPMTTQSTEP